MDGMGLLCRRSGEEKKRKEATAFETAQFIVCQVEGGSLAAKYLASILSQLGRREVGRWEVKFGVANDLLFCEFCNGFGSSDFGDNVERESSK